MTSPTTGSGHRRWSRLAALPGWLAVVAMVGATLWSLVPIENPGVQQCGAPLVFLLDGKVNAYPDANSQMRRSDGSVDTLTKAEVARAFEHPCSTRVADRMVPVFVVFTAGAALGLVVFLVSLVVWWRNSPPRPKPAPAEEPAGEPAPV